jgi:hypothetical protein
VDFASAARTVNPLAVIAAAVLMFVIGGLWYSPLLFERPWRRLTGLSDAQLSAVPAARVFGVSFVAALVAAITLAFFLAAPGVDVVFGLIYHVVAFTAMGALLGAWR